LGSSTPKAHETLAQGGGGAGAERNPEYTYQYKRRLKERQSRSIPRESAKELFTGILQIFQIRTGSDDSHSVIFALGSLYHVDHVIDAVPKNLLHLLRYA